MSTEPASEPAKNKNEGVAEDPHAQGFDPDAYRMTIGEHLEELRGRLVLALMGLSVAVLGCLLFSEKVMVFFCAPLTKQLIAHDINPQLVYINLTDPFMTYLKVTMVVAASIAGPWILLQIWLFVASGLYPQERKVVTRYIPLSVTLFIGGLVFVYYLVLPLSIKFFIEFSGSLPIPGTAGSSTIVDVPIRSKVDLIEGDPAHPHIGDIWINTLENRTKVYVPVRGGKSGEGTIRVLPFSGLNLLTPQLSISEYIDLAFIFMLTFGIAFQLPLVMLAVVAIGVVDINFLKTKRKLVFFGMTVASAFLAPGDIVTSMLALLIPLVILYEFGLILVKMGTKRKERERLAAEAAEAAEAAASKSEP